MSVQRFNEYISKKTFEGYKIIDKNEGGLTAVLEKTSASKKRFTGLDIFLTLLTSGLWLIVWFIKKPGASANERIRVSFDSSGNLLEEKN